MAVENSAALAGVADDIWRRKYRFAGAGDLQADATVDDTFWRVALAAASVEKGGKRGQDKWARAFRGAMSDFGFLPAGRILSGAGTGRNVTLFNCFVLGAIEDDLTGIFESVKEAALTMQAGGGIGHDFSTLRPNGALVKSIGADASGPVSFMDVWDAMCRTIMSAGQRRGAMMATLRCDHPDIEAFVAAKSDPKRLRNFNLSVLVTDAFMDAVDRDAEWPLTFGGVVYKTVQARALWDQIMRATYDFAEPGVIFIDRVNAVNNLAYCETISATNPCVTADTWVHTSEGPRQVADLVGKPFVARFDGEDYASGSDGFFATGSKPVLRLETEEGHSLRLTVDHRVERVVRMTRWSTDMEWIAAGDLKTGDLIRLCDHGGAPCWPGPLSFEEGYLLGLLVGDGTLKSDKAVLSVWRPAAAVGDPTSSATQGPDAVMAEALRAAKTLPHRTDFSGWSEVAGRSEFRLSLAALQRLAFDVGMTPGRKAVTAAMERASSAFYRGFLRGFFDADGSVQGSQSKGVSVRLAQSDRTRLEAVQRMLLRLGVASSIYDRRPAGSSRLPDGRGGMRSYRTEPQYELIISGENLARFDRLVGFADTRKAAALKRALHGYRRALNRERFVAKVSRLTGDGVHPVFDVQVPGANRFDANGFSAHNCGEQPLPPYGACLLGSINLARLVERPFSGDAAIDAGKLEARVATAVRLLDNVIDVSRCPLEAQRAEAIAKRRIGLGVTGLADALIFCGLDYGAEAGRRQAAAWMSAIQNAAYLASANLAREKGSFPLYDAAAFQARPTVQNLDADVREAIAKHGLRNGCLTSIAPTGTISLLAGNVSSGVEPVFGFSFRRRMLAADGSAREETVEDFAYARHRELIGADAALPSAFVTAEQLSPAQHLAMQAALQPFVDSAISKTINCPEAIAFNDFRDIYRDAYRGGLKGCTTYRPNAITGAVLAPVATQPAAPAVSTPALRDPAQNKLSGVVYMTKPLERDDALDGVTYKIKWPASAHALYVTVNDIVRDGRRRPFEIFINTKNLEHYAWTVALTRMISAVFRRGGDVSFVAEELKAVFDPEGGRWMDGRYVPSLLAAIGDVIEQHMIRTGFLTHEAGLELSARVPRAASQDLDGGGYAIATGTETVTTARICPKCGQRGLNRIEGCWTCVHCDFSKCG